MNQEKGFQIKEIKQEQIPVYNRSPKKKDEGLISLFSKKNLLKTLLVVIIVFILVAAAAIIWGRHSFSRAKVEIGLEAPKDIASGEEITFTINYKNNNRVNLNDAYLIVDYPSGTFSLEGKEIYQEQESLGTIMRKSQGKKDFKIRLVGEKGDVKNITVKLDYQPQNISSRFENSTIFRIEINSVLIGLNVDGSEQTLAGQEVSYLIEYENKTDSDISDLRIELAYSQDFEFTSANPSPELGEEEENNNVWQVGLLNPGEKGTIDLKGILNGNEGESKILKVTAGRIENETFLQYSQIEFVTQIAPPPITLLLKVQKSDEECIIDPGQTLNYEIEFRNNTDIALRELILKLYFQDDIFDFKELELGETGFFDSRENVITWSGGEVSSLNLLEPNQSDKVNFSVKIKESLPIFSYNDKNFQAKVLAEIETLTVPDKFSISELKVEKELICKINSQLDLKTKVYYYEPSSGIVNTGPISPRVDQLTTYTVHWQIGNTSNDLEDVKVSAILPQGIEWSNHYINKVKDSQILYNQRTKEISWEIDRIPASTGVILPAYELIFQIGLRPSLNQLGSTPILINESSAEGKDIFTNTNLRDFTPIIDTTLPDDSRISSSQGVVKE